MYLGKQKVSNGRKKGLKCTTGLNLMDVNKNFVKRQKESFIYDQKHLFFYNPAKSVHFDSHNSYGKN